MKIAHNISENEAMLIIELITLGKLSYPDIENL